MDRRHHKNKYQAFKCLRKHRLHFHRRSLEKYGVYTSRTRATWLFPTCAMLGILYFMIVVKCVLCAQKHFKGLMNMMQSYLFLHVKVSVHHAEKANAGKSLWEMSEFHAGKIPLSC